jgi:hypothetical protein
MVRSCYIRRCILVRVMIVYQALTLSLRDVDLSLKCSMQPNLIFVLRQTNHLCFSLDLSHRSFVPRRLAAAELINEILGEGTELIPLGKFPPRPNQLRRHRQQVHHHSTSESNTNEGEQKQQQEQQQEEQQQGDDPKLYSLPMRYESV